MIRVLLASGGSPFSTTGGGASQADSMRRILAEYLGANFSDTRGKVAHHPKNPGQWDEQIIIGDASGNVFATVFCREVEVERKKGPAGAETAFVLEKDGASYQLLMADNLTLFNEIKGIFKPFREKLAAAKAAAALAKP